MFHGSIWNGLYCHLSGEYVTKTDLDTAWVILLERLSVLADVFHCGSEQETATVVYYITFFSGTVITKIVLVL